MSESHTGDRNAFYGKHHTDETKQLLTGRPISDKARANMSEAKKGILPVNIDALKVSRIGATNSDYQRQRVREANTGLVRSEETKQKISENRSGIGCGPANSQWKGGTSFLPYCHKFNERRKRAVRNFFGNVCLLCNKPAEKNECGERGVIALAVHHIDHNKEQGCSGVPFNLVPLCHDCHNNELFDVEGYKTRINAILDAGFASGRWDRERYLAEVMYPEDADEV